MDSRKYVKSVAVLLGLVCLVVVGNAIWLYIYKPTGVVRLPESESSPYTREYGSNVYAPLQVGERFENGTLTKSDTLCSSPRVIVTGDVSAEDRSAGKIYGRIPNDQGVFKTILNPTVVQEVVVVDGDTKSSDEATRCLIS